MNSPSSEALNFQSPVALISTRKTSGLIILLIILIGFSSRAFLLRATADIPLHGDERVYYKLGTNLSDDFPPTIRSKHFLKRAPSLPFLLATTHIAIGPGPYLAKWSILFSGTISIALGYSLARRQFGHRAGLAAALFLALYPEFIVLSTMLFTEIPFITLNLASFLLLLHYQARPQRDTLLLAGILWALTILTRDQALYFTPFIALWLAWHHTGSPLHRLLRAIAFLGIVLIGLSPWMTRNFLITGRVAFVTQREGITLFRRGGNHDPQLDLRAWCAQYTSLRRDWTAKQRFALGTLLDYIRRAPLEWAAGKIQRFWQNLSQVYLEAFRRIEMNIYGEIVPRYTFPILWITALAFLLLSLGWILGLVSAPGSAGRNLLFLWLGYSAMLYIVAALLLRTRSTFLAILTLFAGYFWGQPLAALHRLRSRPWAALLASLLLFLLLANLTIYPSPSRIDTCIGNFQW